MISDRYRFIFVHINKTGGTSIEKIFEPRADQMDVSHKHESAEFYKKRFPYRFLDYFKFSFVRNPWDWLVSRYFWSKDHQCLINYSFRELLLRLEDGARLSASAPWMEGALAPQLNRLTVSGSLSMDFVGRFEKIQSDFEKICSIMQMKARPLPHVFMTQHAEYTEYYDDETMGIVERLYAADIAAFRYRFGS